MNFSELLATTPQPAVDLNKLAAVEGWVSNEAIDLTLRIGHLQHAMAEVTGVLELGVYKGKYLSLLAAIYGRHEVPIVGVDAFLARIGEQVSPEDQTAVQMLITRTIATVAPSASTPTLIAAFTSDLTGVGLRRFSPRGYSFISLDAGHEAADIEHDLALAESVISTGTVVAVDDAFNQRVPGVAEGMCRYFFSNPGSKLAPFAWCVTKLFLCTREMHQTYLGYVYSTFEDPKRLSYIIKTEATHKQDAASGFTARLFGYELVVFDWG